MTLINAFWLHISKIGRNDLNMGHFETPTYQIAIFFIKSKINAV
jgi:hypothetical protein